MNDEPTDPPDRGAVKPLEAASRVAQQQGGAPPVALGVPQPSGSSIAEIVSATGGADAARLNAGAENVSTIVRPDGTVEASASRSPPRSPSSAADDAPAPQPVAASQPVETTVSRSQSAAEAGTRRAASLAKQASGIAKRSTKKASAQHRKPRKSVTDGMTNLEKIDSAIQRQLIRFVYTPDDELPDAPAGLRVVLPGPEGNSNYVFKIRDRLKTAGFRFNTAKKLWYDVPPDDAARPGDFWPTLIWQ